MDIFRMIALICITVAICITVGAIMPGFKLDGPDTPIVTFIRSKNLWFLLCE